MLKSLLSIGCKTNHIQQRYIRKLNELVDCKISENLDGLCVVSLNRPSKKNALNRELLNSIDVTFDEINKKINQIKVVIVRSAVPGMFCAGADLIERLSMDDLGVQRASSNIRRIFHKISNLPVPVIAAVDGVALGGGTELAIACDLRVATSRSVFALPETGHAIIPGAGGTQKLQRIVGVSVAKDLIFTGRQIELPEAVKIGLVNYGVELPNKETTEDFAFKKAHEVASQIATRGPVAIRAAKRAIDMGREVELDAGLKIEETCYLEIAQTKDRLEGLNAFKEKRKPKYKGE